MHVIINGVSSETLQGVQVLSLPPITKPRMRTSVAVIDGRPGDIVTRLGYEAYNRKIQILLHHDYDLNAISAFFNTSGKIIFSNEPDMEYEFETIDAFSFERAVQYKTADITFHVQPYKLSASEQSETGEVSTLVDRTPYIIRRTPFGTRQKGTIVGGSIVWNQLIKDEWITSGATTYGLTITNNGDGTVTVNGTVTDKSSTATPILVYIKNALGTSFFHCIKDHKYLYLAPKLPEGVSGYNVLSGSTATMGYKQSNGSAIFNCLQTANAYAYGRLELIQNGATFNNYKYYFRVFDLTLMFGPTIADYIYTQEQATAGAGVALAKAWAGITEDYYPYDAGSIKSVTGLTAHKMTDGNGDVIGEYHLDSSLTLRGLPKLDEDNLYYDGDVYKADGTVERRYGVVDLGTLNWSKDNQTNNPGRFYSSGLASVIRKPTASAEYGAFILCTKYIAGKNPISTPKDADKMVAVYTNGTVYISDIAYTDNTAAEFKTAMSGVYLVYALAEPTTEQAEPYTALQICDPNGTEEWVGASMPVGHETTYIDPISMTVTNEGNTESAPSITIEGEGSAEVTVDGLNILQIQMPASGEITIDSKTLDATDGEGGLANRSVTGDYNDLRIAPGEHTVTVTGDVTSVTIKNASRWI